MRSPSFVSRVNASSIPRATCPQIRLASAGSIRPAKASSSDASSSPTPARLPSECVLKRHTPSADLCGLVGANRPANFDSDEAKSRRTLASVAEFIASASTCAARAASAGDTRLATIANPSER